MFLINRCMYWFVLVCTDTYYYVKLTQQYVCVCTILYLYEQVCSSMYQYVLVCTCMYLLVRKSIITYSSQYQAVPAVTLNPVYLNGPVQRLCSVWYCQVLPCTLLSTSCLNFDLSQYQAVPSTSLESCTPEQTCTKLNQTEQSLHTGPFRCTGFKVTAGTAWY